MSNLKPNKPTAKLPTINQVVAYATAKCLPLYIVVFEQGAEVRGDKFAKSFVALKVDNDLVPTRTNRAQEAQIAASLGASLTRITRGSGADFEDIRIMRVAHDYTVSNAKDLPESLLFEIENIGN